MLHRYWLQFWSLTPKLENERGWWWRIFLFLCEVDKITTGIQGWNYWLKTKTTRTTEAQSSKITSNSKPFLPIPGISRLIKICFLSELPFGLMKVFKNLAKHLRKKRASFWFNVGFKKNLQKFFTFDTLAYVDLFFVLFFLVNYSLKTS